MNLGLYFITLCPIQPELVWQGGGTVKSKATKSKLKTTTSNQQPHPEVNRLFVELPH